MPTNAHTFAASYMLFVREKKILLLRRYNTGFEDGHYSLPAGHVEPNEPFTVTAIREAQEEVGIRLKEEEVTIAHIMHRKSGEREYVDIFCIIEKWTGVPKNMEPEKCDDLSWFPLNNLPENTIPYVRQAIEHSVNKVFYSEYGWDQ